MHTVMQMQWAKQPAYVKLLKQEVEGGGEDTWGEAFQRVARNSVNLFGLYISPDAAEKAYYRHVRKSHDHKAKKSRKAKNIRTSNTSASTNETVTRMQFATELLKFVNGG